MASFTNGIPNSIPGQVSLEEHDPEMYDIIEREKHRQWSGLELIASENLTSKAVMTCLGSPLINKYAEGLPGKRYYGGTEFVDQVETLCQTRALTAYGLDASEWGVNVQPYSGSPANFEVYTALLKPHDRIMGLDLPSGVSATSIYFESLPYRVHPETGLIDYEALEAQADLFKPAMLIMGGSAYPREWDYARFRKIADSCGALLMMDMAHIAGLVATGHQPSPFPYADVNAINMAVFPGLQGGPHMNQYSDEVCKNACALADHLPQKINGSKMQVLCDLLSITLNKNSVLGDKSALTPGGVRIGAGALTTRGFNQDHFRKVGDLLHRATVAKASAEVMALKKECQEFATQFPMPGFDVSTMRYNTLA
eukprot:GSChrysophyteH1.ASY1.ANO1.518.1 assembled CDS